MAKRLGDAQIDNCRITYRNLEGKPDDYNPQGGKRGFSVILEPAIAEAMAKDGWNVKQRPPKEEYTEPLYHLPVTVRYNQYPPSIYLLTSRGKTLLTEDTVMALDFANIESVDISSSPYSWETAAGKGVKAYCKTMFVKIVEDELQKRYADVRDVNDQAEPTVPWDES